MKTLENENLAKYTSFRVGGNAEKLIVIEDTNELEQLDLNDEQLWVLGSGTNSLISDKGLPGTTLILQTSKIEINESTVVADAGVAWDELVQTSLNNNLWGLELMSGIPGSVGAAVVGNIAAYGQAVADSLKSITVLDINTREITKLKPEELNLKYRSSNLQTNKHLVVVSATFQLSTKPTCEVKYQKVIDAAKADNLDLSVLSQRRDAVLKAREVAGSLQTNNSALTAGSFFKNPVVEKEVAEYIMDFEDLGNSKANIVRANKIHGGNARRVSAALVLLAAGFSRGQTWGEVQLHSDHILKITNKGGASAQEIYNVSKLIVSTVKEKLGIELEPEIQFLGDFS